MDTKNEPISVDAIHDALQRVLAGDEFRTSKRCQEFLQYIVENTLNGRADQLKERTIGMELFGKPAAYEPSDDATVRVKAREVRKRLSVYYATQGRGDPVHIVMHAGTYVPTFHPALELSGKAMEDTPEDAAALPAGASRKWIAGLGLVLLFMAVVVAIFYPWHRPAAIALEQFWSPALHSSTPVWLCTSSIPVYRPKSEATPTKLEDLTLINDRFVAAADIAAMSRVSDMLARLRQPYRLRVGNGIVYSDLRTAPAILIGYSYTRWQEIGHEGRYFVTATSVLDNGTARWTLPSFQDDPELREDYAVVSRFLDPNSGNVVIELAGISHYGTEAAAELMTDPALAATALDQLPSGWQSKNVQMVLHVRIISGSPGVPKVVATHVW